MSTSNLYPLRFDPIFQYRLWGGRNLEEFMSTPLPGEGLYGEAWILSDRDDFSSVVAEGPLKGRTLTQLMADFPVEMMGSLTKDHARFPLLLKFLDCRELLSVQVHPSDSQTDLLPPGENGKTEAWVVLQADPAGLIYEGLKPGTTPDSLRRAIAEKAVGSVLPSFAPKAGDAVYIPSGTVHTLGRGVMVFEVQENSDVTFRLYDWDRVDAKTGKPRELSVNKAMAAINFSQGVGRPVDPVKEEESPVHRETLFQCDHFWVWRTVGEVPPTVGGSNDPRILVCLDGSGGIEHDGSMYGIRRGEVMLLPAEIGECVCVPNSPMSLLEIKIPEVKMKKLVVYDLDGTLAESKCPIDAEMASLLNSLLVVARVAVISGGDWPQFEKQVLDELPEGTNLDHLSILPTTGTKFYQYDGDWKKLYSEDFSDEEKKKIVTSLKDAIDSAGFRAKKLWGEEIQDRGSQITYSALGQRAPLDEKTKWDPDFAKRKEIKAFLDKLIPEFSVRLGGATSIDVTKPGIDKGYGVRKLRDVLKIGLDEMIFMGDALFPGGNDYAAEQAGVDSVRVRDPKETKRVTEAVVFCLKSA